ncbi:replicative DNA helicase [Gemmatimonas aurantiaca]|uniref:replicative DNA helicase n=1 Tax=Gemmatimonas aurantiaca TaxID=173480 RepID=UPI0002D2996D|nr:replicative DNA helicase [Gemmatimonas aurantiaca]
MTSLVPAGNGQVPAARDPYKERRPPWSEEAEQAVLGAMLLDADAIMRASEHVDDTMFYREGHRRLHRAMIAITERGGVVDPLTLADELERRGELEHAGGREYLAFLLDAVPTVANVEYHARIVKEKALLRRLIEVSTEVVQEAFEGRITATDLLDSAESRIFSLGQSKERTGFARIKELLWPAMEKLELLSQRDQAITGVPTGFVELDHMTSGFQPADLIIVAARPSMGKTAFTLNIAQHSAITAKVPVAFFSLEMSKESLVQRMLASEALIDAQALRKGGRALDESMPRLAKAAGILSHAPIFIDDTPGITLLEMRAKSRRLKAEHNLGLIIVDYLQLMTGPAGVENRQQEVSQISRGLKALAKELGVPVVALSQLSRAPEQRTGDDKGRPQLSDLRESGAIEQDADVIMFIFRQEVYAERDENGRLKDPTLEGRAEIIIGKQRNGPIGSARLFFHKQYTRFDNFSPRQAPPEYGDGGGSFGGPKLVRGPDDFNGTPF